MIKTKLINDKLIKNPKIKMLKGKKAWIKIVEAVTAILIIISVVIVFVSKTIEKPDVSATMRNLEKSILDDIAQNGTVRSLIVDCDGCSESDLAPIKDFIRLRMPVGLQNNFDICIIDTVSNCKPSNFLNNLEFASKEIFVDDRLIFEQGETKKISLFIWLK